MRVVDRLVAGATVGGDHRVGVAEDVEVAGDASVLERQARGVDAEPLPHLHLALVALGDLLVEIKRHHRMDGIGRHEITVDDGPGMLGLDHRLPMGVETLAEARGQADAGDPDLTRHGPHPPRAHRGVDRNERDAAVELVAENFARPVGRDHDDFRVGGDLVAHPDRGFGDRETGALVGDLGVDHHGVAGHDEAAELGALDAAQEDEPLHVLPAEQQVAGGVVHEFQHHHAGQNGIAGEVPVEHRAGLGQRADHANGQAVDIQFGDTVDQIEIFETHQPWADFWATSSSIRAARFFRMK